MAHRSGAKACPVLEDRLPSVIEIGDSDRIATVLREEVLRFYAERNEKLSGAAGANTLETNSGLAESRARAMVDLVLRRLHEANLAGVRLLDAGCGFGALAVVFAAHGARVTAFDPNGERLAVGRRAAKRLGLAIDFQQGLAQDVKLPSASFDAVVMNNSLCYIVARDDRHTALVTAARLLRPGGAIAIRNPNRLFPIDQFTGLPLVHWLPPRPANRVAERLRGHRSLVRLVTPKAGRRELRRAGFVNPAYEGLARRLPTKVLNRFARYQHLTAIKPA